MNWHLLNLGPLGTNCYICSIEKQAIIIDPGGDFKEVESFLKDKGITPIAILLTHAHFDHIGAVEKIRDKFSISVYLHDAEWNWLSNPKLNGSALFPVEEVMIKEADEKLQSGQLSIGNFSFEVRHTPGHSPGSVSFINHQNKLVFSGDALFQSGIGRTDLPGGSMEELLSSIKNQLYTLNEDYQVLPGHGLITSIGIEREYNPFIKK